MKRLFDRIFVVLFLNAGQVAQLWAAIHESVSEAGIDVQLGRNLFGVQKIEKALGLQLTIVSNFFWTFKDFEGKREESKSQKNKKQKSKNIQF